jgi:hypothetical protein
MSTTREGPYVPAQLAARGDARPRYAIRLTLAGGAKIFIANSLIRDPALIEMACRSAVETSGGDREVYGRSLQGRDLVAYRFSANRSNPKGTILISSGFHQAEADTLASEAVLRWLGTPAAAEVRSRYDVCVVPMVNPDGFALGTQGSNAADVNIYWWFARDDAARCPEAAALWSFAAKLAPVGYIDFHGYTVQLDKDAGPYLKPISYYRSPAVRRAAAHLEKRVVHEFGAKPMRGFAPIAPNTLGAMLTDAFDTLTMAKYHLHLKHGPEHYGEHGIHAVVAMADSLTVGGVEGGLSQPLTKSARALRATRAYWSGFLRPTLGAWRRGRFTLDTRRNAVIGQKTLEH